MRRLLAAAALVSVLSAACANLAAAQDAYVGEIRLFGYNWCPNGWLQANGQLLAVNQYQALFALYGTNFGGNGVQNFGLPNLSGRAPYGQASGGMGEPFAALYGTSTVTLNVSNLPAHTHQLYASSGPDFSPAPSGALLPTYAAGKFYTAANAPADKPMAGNAIGITGSNVPVTVQSPALSLNWCVAITGYFPQRP